MSLIFLIVLSFLADHYLKLSKTNSVWRFHRIKENSFMQALVCESKVWAWDDIYLIKVLPKGW